jgi:hypothetical protein
MANFYSGRNQEAKGINHERIISHGRLRDFADLSLLPGSGLRPAFDPKRPSSSGTQPLGRRRLAPSRPLSEAPRQAKARAIFQGPDSGEAHRFNRFVLALYPSAESSVTPISMIGGTSWQSLAKRPIKP